MSDDQSEDSTDVQTDGQADAGENGECFVIAPIGGPNSETRKQTDGLLDEAIRPVVEDKIGFTVIAPHEIAEAGSITRQVIQRLLEAELVVADLTGLNANVMYELAVRHAKGKPVVPIAERGTSLPFDITTERTIFYEESFHGLNELKPKLEDAVRAALEDEEPDNPIYRAQQTFQMREAIAGDDKMEYLMDRLDDIESLLNAEARTAGGDVHTKAIEAFENIRSAKEPQYPIDVDRLSDEELETILDGVEDAHALYGLDYKSKVMDQGGSSHLLLLVPEETLDDTEEIVRQVVGDSRYEMM